MNAEQKASLDALRTSSAEREWRERAEDAEAELSAALDLLSEIANTIPTSPARGHTVWARERARAFLSSRTPEQSGETNMGDWG